ncbi:MAG: amino acid--tRNA ligase-related protein [Patescibacteria group bacterium UBA2163]
MERTLIRDLHDHIDTEVLVNGWVSVRRDHGKLIFLDIRDRSGIVQAVALPNNEGVVETADTLRPEYVVAVTAKVNARPEKMVNEDEQNGDIELELLSITTLNESKTPPFELTEDTSDIEETLRLKYRYLDLRTERMQRNIKVRSEFIQRCRDFLFERDFTEIETPLLTESTAEGSRDFVVPSRINPGKFYALPQSPQQYKELLMTAGFERYFQIARAIRDEDLRADRGFEHTQLDLEISFMNQEDIMQLIENMMTTVVEAMGHTIKEKPFPVISYQDAMEKYGADKFDLRTEEDKQNNVLAFAWVVDFPLFEKTDEGAWTFSHNPFSLPKPEYQEAHLAGKDTENIISTQYDLVCNGFEVGGGSLRAYDPQTLTATYKTMGYSEEEIERMVGHMREAYSFGTPPHGGLALGIERNIMNLVGEDALREVQAFPMTRGGQTSVMNGPSELSKEQLKELRLSINEKEKDGD